MYSTHAVDAMDNCGFIPNADQRDEDGDFVGDTCDNCPLIRNSNQGDADRDGFGDICDNCPFIYNPLQDENDLLLFGFLCTGYAYCLNCSDDAVYTSTCEHIYTQVVIGTKDRVSILYDKTK